MEFLVILILQQKCDQRSEFINKQVCSVEREAIIHVFRAIDVSAFWCGRGYFHIWTIQGCAVKQSMVCDHS